MHSVDCLNCLIRLMRNSRGFRSYRSKAVAVQTVSVMIPLNPEVTIRNSNISVFVAESPERKRTEDLVFNQAIRQSGIHNTFLQADEI